MEKVCGDLVLTPSRGTRLGILCEEVSELWVTCTDPRAAFDARLVRGCVKGTLARGGARCAYFHLWRGHRGFAGHTMTYVVLDPLSERQLGADPKIEYNVE